MQKEDQIQNISKHKSDFQVGQELWSSRQSWRSALNQPLQRIKRLPRRNVHALSIFTNPSAWEEYDTRSIFKQSLTGLNSEFSFS